MERQNVALVGIGAIGSVIFSQLKTNETIDISCFNRSQKDKVVLEYDNKISIYPIDCQSVMQEDIDFDWLVICLKQYHFLEAENLLGILISPNTKVAVIRNGLNLKQAILPFASADNILECMIDCPVQRQLEGSYLQLRKPIISIEKSMLAKDFQSLFPLSNISFREVDDFHTVAWEKLCESSSIGAITALSGRTAEVFTSLKVRNLYAQFLLESISIAQADGAKIDTNFYSEMLEKLSKYPPEKGSSMLTDRLAANPIELGAKNRIIVNTGLKYGIAMPLNLKTCRILAKPDLQTNYLNEFISL